jgi:hypothetical protein
MSTMSPVRTLLVLALIGVAGGVARSPDLAISP